MEIYEEESAHRNEWRRGQLRIRGADGKRRI